MNNLRALTDRLRSIPLLAVVTLIAIILAAISAVSSVSSFFATLAIDGSAAATDREQAQLDEFQQSLSAHAAQVDGRSLFHRPGPPRPPRVDIARPDPGPGGPIIPSRYGGPSIIAMINGAVWFGDGQRIAEGDSGRGIEVVSINAPWGAKVRWQGAEFDVSLFQKDTVIWRTGAAALTPVSSTSGGSFGSAVGGGSGSLSQPASSTNARPSGPSAGPAQPQSASPGGPPQPPQDAPPGEQPPPPPDPNGAGGEPPPPPPLPPGSPPSEPSAPEPVSPEPASPEPAPNDPPPDPQAPGDPEPNNEPETR